MEVRNRFKGLDLIDRMPDELWMEVHDTVQEIENKIFAMDQKEIDSSIIGEMIMDKLKDLDAVAYVRFASVYREFKDVNTFMEELKKILE